jgi:hypothetical protein
MRAVDADYEIDCKESMVRSAKNSGAKRQRFDSARVRNCKKRDTCVVKTSFGRRSIRYGMTRLTRLILQYVVYRAQVSRHNCCVFDSRTECEFEVNHNGLELR